MRLRVDNLSFSFSEAKVLRNISFEVAEDEFLGLMGPNGSGKTTLLRCLTRYLPSDAKAVLVDMKPLHTLPDKDIAKLFAVVPQSSSTDFPFTAYDIVMMGRIPHIQSRLGGESRRDEEIVLDALKRANASRLAYRPFFELSGGERQRVIIARALAQQPKALLLDEPTVYLDISGQFEMMDLIRKLNREEGMTIIAVLHDINLAARYCDRIALLNQGRLEVIGPPADVLTPDIIQEVYGVEVAVRRDPFTHAVYVMPRSSPTSVRRHGARVHLLCGGGTGGPLMKALTDHGFAVSAGVLNVLDSDYENAADLRIPVVAEVPFAQISDEAHAENLRLVDEAAYVVVSRFPVGPGNFKNLEAAKGALKMGKKVLVVSPENASAVDFVGGKADALIGELTRSGATAVRSFDELLSKLQEEGE